MVFCWAPPTLIDEATMLEAASTSPVKLTGAPGDEVPYGPQWEIELPTQLVRLRADGKLPVWTQPDPNVWTWTTDDGS